MNLSDAYWDHILPTRLNTSVTSSPYFKLFLIAQIKEGDQGFLSKHITVQAMIENRGDIHHLFPKKYLQNNGFGGRGDYNQVANYAITQSEINIKIKDSAPCVYIGEVLKQIDNKKPTIGCITEMAELKENFRQNCIPEEFFNYSIENYEEFLEKRRILMANKIKNFYYDL